MKMKKRILMQSVVAVSVIIGSSFHTVNLYANNPVNSSLSKIDKTIKAYNYSIEGELQVQKTENKETKSNNNEYNVTEKEITLKYMDKLTLSNDNQYSIIRNEGETEEGYLDTQAIITVEEESEITIDGEVTLGQIIMYERLKVDGEGILNIICNDGESGIYIEYGNLDLNNISLNISGGQYGINAIERYEVSVNNVELDIIGNIAGMNSYLMVADSNVNITGNYFGILDGSVNVSDNSVVEINGSFIGSTGEISLLGNGGKVTSTGGRVGHYGALATNESSEANFIATGTATGTETDCPLFTDEGADLEIFPEDMPNRDELTRATGSGTYGLILGNKFNIISGTVKGTGATAGIISDHETWQGVSIIRANIEGIGTGTGNYVYGIMLIHPGQFVYFDADTVAKGISNGKGSYNDFKSIGIYSDGGFHNEGTVEGEGGGIGIYSSSNIHQNEKSLKGIGTGENSAGIVTLEFYINGNSEEFLSEAYGKGEKYGIISREITLYGSAVLTGEADNYAIRTGIVNHILSEDFNLGQIEVNNFGLIKAIAKDRNSGEAAIMVGEGGSITVIDGSKIIEQYKSPKAILAKDKKVKPYASEYLNGKNMVDFMDYQWKTVANNGDDINIANNGTVVEGLIDYDDSGIRSLKDFDGTLMAIRTDKEDFLQPVTLLSTDPDDEANPGGTHIILMPAGTVLPPVDPPKPPAPDTDDDDDDFIPEKGQGGSGKNNNNEENQEEENGNEATGNEGTSGTGEEVTLEENETPLGNGNLGNETGEEIDLEESETPLGNGEFENNSEGQKNNPITGFNNRGNFIFSSILGTISIIIAKFQDGLKKQSK